MSYALTGITSSQKPVYPNNQILNRQQAQSRLKHLKLGRRTHQITKCIDPNSWYCGNCLTHQQL
jgi:hypothetical protein